jgi:hypothetical protein
MEDKNLEKEKLEREIQRSLSVVKMKEAHKQIEDIEKLRKQLSIKSIYERISSCLQTSSEVNRTMMNVEKQDSKMLQLSISEEVKKILNTIIATYESICFDLQRTLDIKKEDFDKLFPKMEFNFSTFSLVISNLLALCIRLEDMKKYCLRLL